MNIIGIPALVGTYDNYIWVLFEANKAWVFDPGEAPQVIDFLNKNNLDLQAILITHFHHDHVEGIPGLKQAFPNAHVYGPEKTDNPFIETKVKQGDQLTLNSALSLKVMNTPGHTQDHIAYYNDDLLFCGDTLFTGGCGRKFTGSFEEFTHSILKLRALPDSTQFYCAHEYTESNLKFAHLVEPDSHALKRRIKNTHIDYPSNHIGAQSSLAEEKATNPFMRFDLPEVKTQLLQRGAEDNPVSLFKTLREWKDQLDQSGELDSLTFAELQNQL
ncbi:MAG: hydroxyacylglutathione hydrolase [Pseudomonadota bacterium]|nr:hydroxyacylglutathione hydrolase [Pseudomonadota bacterium]